MKTILIQGNQARISINVEKYSHVIPEDESDANWLDCEVELTIGSVTAVYRVNITTFEFRDFKDELTLLLKTCSGKARLLTCESGITLNIELLPRGSGVITGEVLIHEISTVNLSFKAETDQSYLGQSLESLNEVVHTFPYRNLR